METKRPLVGLAVIICKEERVLLGKRKGAHGSGSWAFPGGHLEFNESFEACARREVLEETGLTIRNVRPAVFTNDLFEKEQRHYVTLFILADYDGGRPELKEPDKCEAWEWFAWNQFPEPLFLSLENLLKSGFNPLHPPDGTNPA